MVHGKFVAELARRGVITVNYRHAKANPNRGEKGRHGEGRQERHVEYPPVSHEVHGVGACEHALLNVGSVPMTRVTDADGNEQIVELWIAKQYTRPNRKGSFRHFHTYEIPCVYGAYEYDHRLYRDIDGSINYGEFERFYPTNSDAFRYLYGRRNDTESLNRQRKRGPEGQMPARGMRLQNVYLAFNALRENILALARLRRAGIKEPGVAAP